MSLYNFSQTRERDLQGKFIVPSKPSIFNKKEYDRKYNIVHRKEKIAKAVEWGRKNKEKRKIVKNRWRVKNREKINFLKRLYIYRKKNAEGKHTLKDIKKLYEKFKFCPYCNI